MPDAFDALRRVIYDRSHATTKHDMARADHSIKKIWYRFLLSQIPEYDHRTRRRR